MGRPSVESGPVAPDFLPKSEQSDGSEGGGYPLELRPDYERKREAIERALEHFETPFLLYDERGIRETARHITSAFEWAPGYRQHYAVKACPTTAVIEALHAEGSGADCSSMPELNLAERAGMRGEEIMFTSNNTPPEEFERATELGAIINFDDLTQLRMYLEMYGHSQEIGCARFNPGELKEGNEIIGRPEESKFGMRRDQLSEAYRLLKEGGATRFGLHTMVVSNELHEPYFADTARLLFKTVRELEAELDIQFEFVNLGGGFGIPYRPEDESLDLEETSNLIRHEYVTAFGDEHTGPRILTEMGRYPTGPHGVLVTRNRYVMEKYRKIAGVDATMADNMRPGMYKTYHHISAHGKEGQPATEIYDVVGSLCEGNDKFAIQRELPELEAGDVLIVHDAGAHVRAMRFNYNGKLCGPEILLREDGTLEMIRRPETEDDYFTTLDLSSYEGEVVIPPPPS